MTSDETKSVNLRKLFVANSTLMIVLSLIFMSMMVSVIFSMQSPFAMMGALFSCQITFIVVLLEYWAAFKRSLNALKILVAVLIAGVVFCLFALVSSTIEMLSGETPDIAFVIVFSSVCVPIIAYLSFSIYLNTRYAKEIRDMKSTPVAKKSRFKVYHILLLIFLFSSIGAVFGYREHGKYDYAQNVESVSWLPPTASNVSYYKSYFFTAYEFNIPEKDFLALAKKKKWHVKAIEEPFPIMRYNYIVESSGEEKRVYISNGYFFEHRRRDGGGVSVAFDSIENKAYFQSSPR